MNSWTRSAKSKAGIGSTNLQTFHRLDIFPRCAGGLIVWIVQLVSKEIPALVSKRCRDGLSRPTLQQNSGCFPYCHWPPFWPSLHQSLNHKQLPSWQDVPDYHGSGREHLRWKTPQGYSLCSKCHKERSIRGWGWFREHDNALSRPPRSDTHHRKWPNQSQSTEYHYPAGLVSVWLSLLNCVKMMGCCDCRWTFDIDCWPEGYSLALDRCGSDWDHGGLVQVSIVPCSEASQLTCDTRKELSGKVLDLTTRKGNKSIAFQEIKNTLTK